MGLNETIDQLAMTNSVCGYGHALRMAFDYEIKSERKRGRRKRTWKKQVDGESVKVGLRMEDTLC